MPTIAEDIKDLQNAGFDNNEIESFKKEKINELEQAGFNDKEILEEFGHKQIDLKPIQQIWQNVIDNQRREKKSIYERLNEIENN